MEKVAQNESLSDEEKENSAYNIQPKRPVPQGLHRLQQWCKHCKYISRGIFVRTKRKQKKTIYVNG